MVFTVGIKFKGEETEFRRSGTYSNLSQVIWHADEFRFGRDDLEFIRVYSSGETLYTFQTFEELKTTLEKLLPFQ